MGATPFLYLQLDTLCVCILMILCFNLRISGDNRSQQIYLNRALIGSSIMIVFDAIGGLIRYDIIQPPAYVIHIITISFLASEAIMSFFWAVYSEHIQQSNMAQSKKWHHLMLLPPILVLCMAVASPWTGWAYLLTEDGQVNTGTQFVLLMALCYAAPLISLVKSLILSFNPENESRKYELRIMSAFVLYPLITGALQLLMPGTSCLSVSITLASVLVFVFMQNRLISLDPLTGLNNRYQLYSYLARRLPEYKLPGKRKLYMMVLDIDDFKTVNDTYGHVEGDKTLALAANAMKRACQATPAFISRMGGDEFVILCEFDAIEQANALCERINALLAEAAADLPFEIHACYGVAAYPGEPATSQQFLELADAELYKAKRTKKKGRL